ncbi:hypothetical protein EYB33_12255 [Lysinibacillus sphaericus]|uniref:hypothetical protein n=1 Tax=Lysinibacillus TaxID=400634 RepID=UPI00084A5F5D|nr:hypothetical protein [Lysinibacillus sphaericus]OEC01262.1 hypothetical protein GY31_13220 [Lysinibacillus sphaericus]UDK97030.1 hypothetical protein EYB33_12255 [Lysinibacillus sphaericus]
MTKQNHQLNNLYVELSSSLQELALNTVKIQEKNNILTEVLMLLSKKLNEDDSEYLLLQTAFEFTKNIDRKLDILSDHIMYCSELKVEKRYM